MSSVCIDICFFSSDQVCAKFRTSLFAEITAKNIPVLYSKGQFENEVKKAPKIRSFFLQLDNRNQLHKVDETKYKKYLAEYKKMPEVQCRECDDPHIFSMLLASKCKYLFTADGRILVCRQKIRKNSKGKKYCDFRYINKENVYKKHRQSILKSS